jgi:hypothetical protein
VVSGVVALLVAAGCSSSSSGGGTPPTNSPQPTATVTVTASPTVTRSATSTPTPSPSPSVAAAAGCRTKHLKLSIGQGQGAAGSSYQPIVFTNTGSKPCSLVGYPGTSFLDSGGSQLGVPAIQSPGSKRSITLAPGGNASALLQIPDPGIYSAGQCAPANAAELNVYPPNQTVALQVADSTTICTTKRGASKVRPVVSGSTGE